ncbi:unnamed protein product, partial [Brassica oleracea]
ISISSGHVIDVVITVRAVVFLHPKLICKVLWSSLL